MPIGQRPAFPVSGGPRPQAKSASQLGFQGLQISPPLFRAPPCISTQMHRGGARRPITTRHEALPAIRVRQLGTLSSLTVVSLRRNASGNRSHCSDSRQDNQYGRDRCPSGGNSPLLSLLGEGDRRPTPRSRRNSPGLCPGHTSYTHTGSGQRDTPPPVRKPLHILLRDAYGQARALLTCGCGSMPTCFITPTTPQASRGYASRSAGCG